MSDSPCEPTFGTYRAGMRRRPVTDVPLDSAILQNHLFNRINGKMSIVMAFNKNACVRTTMSRRCRCSSSSRADRSGRADKTYATLFGFCKAMTHNTDPSGSVGAETSGKVAKRQLKNSPGSLECSVRNQKRLRVPRLVTVTDHN